MFPACFCQKTYMTQGLVNEVLKLQKQVSSSLIGYPINRALCHICYLTKATSWKHTHM